MIRPMAKPASNLRLFVALYPPMGVVESLDAALDELDIPAHRRTLPEQVHMTVQFIGDTPAEALETALESVTRSVAGIQPFELNVMRLTHLPQRGAARLIAAETDDPPGLLEMQCRLAVRFSRSVRRKPGDRFLPHLTVCRFRTPAKIGPIQPDWVNA